MRKKHIKSVAHWVIMCFVLLFPIVLVGVSSFAKEENQTEVNIQYKYETNEVDSVEDLIEGNIYEFSADGRLDNYMFNCNQLELSIISLKSYNFESEDIYLDDIIPSMSDYNYHECPFSIVITNNDVTLRVYFKNNDYIINVVDNASWFDNAFKLNCICVIDYIEDVELDVENIPFHKCPQEFIPIESVEVNEVTSTMRQDINNWTSDFVNLPVNGWYGSLLSAIGINLTANSLMRVLYVYPLYVIWVYILDLVVDLLLVIVKLGHNALQKLGGEND